MLNEKYKKHYSSFSVVSDAGVKLHTFTTIQVYIIYIYTVYIYMLYILECDYGSMLCIRGSLCHYVQANMGSVDLFYSYVQQQTNCIPIRVD